MTSQRLFLAIPVPLVNLGVPELKKAGQRVYLLRVPDGLLLELMLEDAFLLLRESGMT